MTPIVGEYWTPWGLLYRAHDDDRGADSSPYGEGKTPDEAIADLAMQLEEQQ